jgi:hypothetical protein
MGCEDVIKITKLMKTNEKCVGLKPFNFVLMLTGQTTDKVDSY